MSNCFSKVGNGSKQFEFLTALLQGLLRRYGQTNTFSFQQVSCLFGEACFLNHSCENRQFACGKTLRHRTGNLPPAFSTAFIPACASYFLSYSAHFLFCHSYCSFDTIVPRLAKKRHCLHGKDNIQFVSSHPRISSAGVEHT